MSPHQTAATASAEHPTTVPRALPHDNGTSTFGSPIVVHRTVQDGLRETRTALLRLHSIVDRLEGRPEPVAVTDAPVGNLQAVSDELQDLSVSLCNRLEALFGAG